MTKNSQEVRNGKPSRLMTLLLAGSMLVGLGSISGCITPQGRQFINTMGYTAAGTFVKGSVRKEMGHRDYQNKQGTAHRRGQYFIVVNLATGESKTIDGPHWRLYTKIIKTKKRDIYPEGFKMFRYDVDGDHCATVSWNGKGN